MQGAEILSASTPSDVMKIFARGSSRRTTASTQMNMESSRSHLICSMVVKMTNRRTGALSMGKLTLVVSVSLIYLYSHYIDSNA